MTGYSTRYEKNLKLLRERGVRLAVESWLKSSRQLWGATPVAHKLRAYVLRDKSAQQRAEMRSMRNENQRIKSDLMRPITKPKLPKGGFGNQLKPFRADLHFLTQTGL